MGWGMNDPEHFARLSFGTPPEPDERRDWTAIAAIIIAAIGVGAIGFVSGMALGMALGGWA